MSNPSGVELGWRLRLMGQEEFQHNEAKHYFLGVVPKGTPNPMYDALEFLVHRPCW
jgi:hypothetical protein